MVPRLRPDLFYTRKGDRHLFLNPGIPDWLVVNGNGAYVLGRCTGEHSAADIAAHVVDLGGDAAEAEALLARALEHGLLDRPGAAPPPPEDLPPEEPAWDDCRCAVTRRGVSIVHVALTNRCNLRCLSCYAGSGRSAGILSLTELADLARQVEAASAPAGVEWVLSGGEPLLHPACQEFAAHLRVKGHSVSLLTNGVLVTPDNAQTLATGFDLIKVSLDGAREETHARTRGTGNFAAVVRSIDLLLAAGANVRVASVVHRENRGDLAELVARYGERLTFQPFFPAGRGAAEADLALTGEEYYAALFETPGVRPLGEIDRVLAMARGRGIRHCAAGGGEISVDEAGDVYPCQMFHQPQYKAGNIRRQPLAEILASPVLRRLAACEVEALEGCAACPVRLICGGACRARAFHETGRDDAAGPFCAYERLVYVNGLIDTAIL